MGLLAIVLFVFAVAAYVAIGLAFLAYYPLADSPFDYAYIVLTWPLQLALLLAVAPFVLACQGARRLIRKGGPRG